jgi:uncharacterized protein (TIGR02118 family)
MLKMMFMVRRRSDLDADTFSKYWRETHAPIAKMIPGLRKYIQHHAIPGPDGSIPPYDGIAEMWYDDAAALEQAMSTQEGQAAQADAEKCVDLERLLVISVDQNTVV